MAQQRRRYEDVAEVQRFARFLQIPSVSHDGPRNGTYKAAVDYLRSLLDAIPGVQVKVVECSPGRPVLVATLVGTEPSLPSILLNGHYDVVPVDRSKWHHDPFSGEVIAETGEIVGRGSQDMKCVCMQYIEAVSRFVNGGKRFRRTVHMTFVPDEEIGGGQGMQLFAESEDFKALNVGFALDEGLANDQAEETYTVFYGERAVWWLQVRATGVAGHGSRLLDGTAMEKLITCVNRFLEFRAKEKARLHGGCDHAVALKLGDVITINLTALRGGHTSDGGETFALNTIPTDVVAGFDIRIPPSVPMEEFEAKVKEWTDIDGVSLHWQFKVQNHSVSDVNPESNKFWATFQDTMKRLDKKIVVEVFPAGTDSRYIRNKNIPAFGFSPMPKTPILLHDHNERLSCQTYLDGISLYEHIIADLANSP